MHFDCACDGWPWGRTQTSNFFCSFLPTLDTGRSLARPFIEKELERERDVYICIYSHTKRIIHRRCVRSLLIIYIYMFPRKKTPKTYMYTECIIHAFCFAVFLVCWVCFAVLSFAQRRLTIFLFAGFVLPFCLSHSIVWRFSCLLVLFCRFGFPAASFCTLALLVSGFHLLSKLASHQAHHSTSFAGGPSKM